MTYLKDGESRVIRAKSWGNKDIKITATREDSDTPIITMEYQGNAIGLTDTCVRELVERLNRALYILPTSK